MSTATLSPTPYRVGKWLPSDVAHLSNFIQKISAEAELRPRPLHPVIAQFKELIEADAEIFMLFNLMFEEVPLKPPYNKTPTQQPQVRNYNHFLQLLNVIMTKAPEFNETGLVGFPINALLDWPMGTSAGYAAFLNQKINQQFKNVLCEWAKFLGSKDSTYVLSKDPTSGWFGRDAMKAMPNFDTEFQCDPEKEHHGFTSWDDFFTRQFRPGQRPIAGIDDDSIITNACESAPYRIAHHVKETDPFWIKGQPYSLRHMLNNDSFTEQFIGGTVYQAFLSALSYHRWHSPIDGTIVKAYVIDGTYYSEPLCEGFANPDGPDPSAPNNSQGYITEVATRALIFIKADNPAIGTMCFMPVGMAEVSTCQITVYEGQHVKKGDQLGMFHFGGSTHCLIFEPSVNLEFDMHGQQPSLNSNNIPINSRIATVLK